MVTLEPKQDTLFQEGPATAALSNHVHNLIQALSEKLDGVWRYDKYMEDCTGSDNCSQVFSQIKNDDMRHIQMLRDQIERLCRDGQFR